MRQIAVLIATALLASCAGTPPSGTGGSTVTTSVTPTPCPPPSPGPTPLPAVMLYPQPGATAVADNLSAIDFAGSIDLTYGPGSYTLTSGAGTSVPLAAPTIAPSPLPSGAAANPYAADGIKPDDVALQSTLAPATTYTFGYVETVYGGTAPNCYPQIKGTIGTFTTQ